jgi:PAS domain S-box-containing protein
MFYIYSLMFLVAILMIGLVVYYQVSKTIEKNIENELSNATATILNMVQATAKASIKNYLRAVAEKNLDIVTQYYGAVQSGQITESLAKQQLRKILFSQSIGKDGYIYCVDSKGLAVEHPYPAVMGQDFSEFQFVQEQMRRKEGYLEYEWKNPGEKKPRPKALYMIFFKPWDWIISVSCYREEFRELVNISDFKDSILSLTFGKTGYSYVLDSKGEVIVHPVLSGNLWDARDADGIYLVRHQAATKNGKLIYSWRNPGEERFREKIVIYNYIQEYDWIVASACYLEEFYGPLKSVRNIVFTTIVIILVLVLPTTFSIAGGITRPLRQLEQKLAKGIDGDFTCRMELCSKDEIGNLSIYFNRFMDRLQSYSQRIQDEVAQKRKTASALEKSEELFSKAFRSSPSGIFIAELSTKRLIDVNQSFLNLIRRQRLEVVGKSITDLSIFRYPDSLERLIHLLNRDGRVIDMDLDFLNAEGEERTGTINAETVNIWGQNCVLCAVDDRTETKRLELEVVEISERERRQLGQYLHDDLCSHLLGIEVMQKVLRGKMAAFGYGDLASIDKIRDLVQDAINKTTRISQGLCPINIAEQGLELTLEELCRDIQEIYGVSCRLSHDEETFSQDPRISTHIYYIAREAAYNAVKHGKAQHITLSLSRMGNMGKLQIRDDGEGLPKSLKLKGMGIRIMHYRARRIGAVLDARRDGNRGSIVCLIFNLSNNDNPEGEFDE